MRATTGWRTTSSLWKKLKLISSTSASTSMAWRRPDLVLRGRSICVMSPVITAFGVKADAGQEHLHLFDGGVLALIKNDKGVVQRTSAHIGQRGDFDDVTLNQLLHFLKAEHLKQRVIQRAQIRVDLLAQIAGQEARAFRRPRRPDGSAEYGGFPDAPAHRPPPPPPDRFYPYPPDPRRK